jgi:hypothetical protein
MTVTHDIVSPKIQTKMNDCWYACIQMLKSSIMGAKTKPAGPTTLATTTLRLPERSSPMKRTSS